MQPRQKLSSPLHSRSPAQSRLAGGASAAAQRAFTCPSDCKHQATKENQAMLVRTEHEQEAFDSGQWLQEVEQAADGPMARTRCRRTGNTNACKTERPIGTQV